MGGTPMPPQLYSGQGFLGGRFGGGFEELVEFAQFRIDDRWIRQFLGDGFLGFEAVAGDAGDDGFFPGNAALLNEFDGGGEGGAAGGLGPDAFGPGEELDGVDDFAVGGALAPAAGLFDDVPGVVPVGRIPDGDRLGDRIGLLRLDDVHALVDGLDDGVAAGGLGGVDLGADVLDESELDELFVGLVDLGEDGAAGGGDDRVLGELPAELLGDFEAVGLGAFGVVGSEVDVDDGPAVLVGDLGAESVDVVVGAADADHRRAENEGAE